ncbi:MAG: DMT family transporter [Candidatus Roizmanbacteria bacterium]
MIPILFALIGACFMTLYSLGIRLFLKDKGDSRSFTLILILSGTVVLCFLLPFEKIHIELSTTFLFLIIPLALLYTVVDLLFIRARQLEQVSVVSTFVQIGNIWALLGGALFFQESITVLKIISVIAIVFGNVLLSWNGKRINISKGLYLILVASFLFTLGNFIDKWYASFISPSLYKLILFIIEVIILSIFFVPNPVKSVVKEYELQGWKALFVGPFLALAVYFLVKAFESGGEASRILPIFGLAQVFAVIAGIVILGERKNCIKKILASIIVLIGAYLLNS